MSDLYDNLLRATDNTNDITNEKYGVITKITNNLCNVKEENGDLEHSNVPILSNVPCETGDKVVIGFVNNSIYNPIVTGNLTRGVLDYVNEKIEGLEHPCSFTVLNDNLIFDFCDESGHGDPVTNDKPTTEIKETESLSNLGTTTGASQHDINIAIDSLINQGGGGGGNVNIVTEWETTPSNAKVPSEKLVKDSLDSVNNSMDNKISKSETAGLVKNDGTIDTNEYSPNSHIHGQVTSDGKITSTAVTVASADNIVITDASDSSKIKRAANLLTDHVKDSSAHSNIGSSANATQSTINTSIDTALGNKISKSQTAGLVKNDGTIDTNTYSTFSGSYNDLSNKPTIPSKISDLTNDSDFIEKSSTTGLVKNDGSIDTTTYVNTNDSRLSDARTPLSHTHGNLQNDGKVGTSNNANKNVVTDSNGKITTENKPTIPTKISDLTNDSDFVEKSSTSGLLKNDGTVDTSAYITSSSITGKEDKTNKVSSWSSTTTNDHYPSEKLVKDSLDGKQATLVSGTNIKTINNNSLLGSGNITISGGSSVDIVTAWESTLSDSKVPSEKLTKDTLDGKLDNVMSSSAVAVASADYVMIADYSDSNKVKKVANLTAYHIKDDTGHTNIGSNANANQAAINSAIDTALGNKVSKSSTTGLLKNDGTVDTTQYLSSLPTHNHDDRYYTESEMDDALDDKQDLLVSGTNIKTINNTSLLGSGNITIGGGGSSVDIATSWGNPTSDSKVPSEKLTKTSLDDKISKSSTSGLVKNDGTIDTTSYSTFSGSYNDLTNKPSIPSKTSDLTNDSNYISKSSTSGLIKNDGTIDTTTYSTFNGNYNSLTNKPTIPSKTSDLTNDSNFISTSNTSGLIKNDGTIDTTTYSTFNGNYNNLTNKPTIPSKTSDLTNDSNFISKSSTNGLMKNDGTIDTTTYVNTNDSRLSDARTPLSHTHTSSQISDLIDVIYPIGSIYMSVNSTSPQTLFGGTWEQIKDTFLLASGDTYANGTTGGSADATLVSHQHGTNTSGEYFVTSESSEANNTRVTYSSSGNRYVDGMTSSSTPFHHRVGTGYVGSSGTGKNMPPYLAVYVWKRTA